MKIAYFVNSFNSINWGGQATSNGIKKLVQKSYPNAEFVPLTLPSFPMNKIKLMRKYWEKKLGKAILADDEIQVNYYLTKLNIDQSLFDSYDTVCFNGEGAIHAKSGHLIRLMGMLYMFKKRGAFVSALNQTVDLGDNQFIKDVVKKVYSMVDYLAVREPVSQRELNALDLYPEVVADAAYALGKFSDEKINSLISDLNLPDKFIAITGSSYLSRDKKSLQLMRNLIDQIRLYYKDIPLYFLANTKTDIYLAKRLQNEFQYQIFASPQKHDKAMAVIAKSYMIIGGRQHPNIFAAIHQVPFVPLQGNTHKMEGVVELLNYPMEVLKWEDINSSNIQTIFENIESSRDKLYLNVTVPKLNSIKLA
jgi:polysaccharide pyruvyl transferase WcaK-like protein